MFLARNSALWCVWVIGQRFTLALSKSWENFIYVLASTWQPSASYNPLIKICHGYVICQISVQNPSSGFPNKISQAFSNRIKKKNSHGVAKMNYLEDWNAVRDTCKHNFQYQTRNDMSILANSSQWRTTWKLFLTLNKKKEKRENWPGGQPSLSIRKIHDAGDKWWRIYRDRQLLCSHAAWTNERRKRRSDMCLFSSRITHPLCDAASTLYFWYCVRKKRKRVFN